MESERLTAVPFFELSLMLPAACSCSIKSMVVLPTSLLLCLPFETYGCCCHRRLLPRCIDGVRCIFFASLLLCFFTFLREVLVVVGAATP